jgi:four helix bundle protein
MFNYEVYMATKNFTELIVWQKARQFVLNVYLYTKGFPEEELYGLTSQFRRAAVSIPANIAEGYKKSGNTDKAKFINIAQGSLEESQYYLILSNDLGYGENKEFVVLLNEVREILKAYHTKVLSSDS